MAATMNAESPAPQAAALRPQAAAGGDAFGRFAAYVEAEIGVRLPPSKRMMVAGRLRRRMAELGFATLDDYIRHLFRDGALDAERTEIFDAVTTNKTDFFREPTHFRHLSDSALPEAITRRRGTRQPVKLWSAAASTGAEAWTMAICAAEHARATGPFDWAILATDINTRVLRDARRAVYPDPMLAPVPPDLRERWVMRGREGQSGQSRIVPELRRRVRFAQLNLLDAGYPLERDIDIVFLRNVLIYFSSEEQARIVGRVAGHLAPGGILYLGHSESMIGQGAALAQIAPATFKRVD
ncbi:chemotaxis protein CheR [Rhodovulum tesquicola]|uniref:Chemotaxis protein methyltransferase n=1 Tax=Rhodovulum steppense TaxID=540251 RepID=A0A4R1YWZ0_9RHOB|nr:MULTISPECIES: CheR family methyltransferase [Rhodovulum]MCO8145847.1 chemotaxis protein CheR [Rhodovulum tesquicola]TCM85507.1 chemotaxis protein methyltransferase CheR [Rhodovulum steppense]